MQKLPFLLAQVSQSLSRHQESRAGLRQFSSLEVLMYLRSLDEGAKGYLIASQIIPNAPEATVEYLQSVFPLKHLAYSTVEAHLLSKDYLLGTVPGTIRSIPQLLLSIFNEETYLASKRKAILSQLSQYFQTPVTAQDIATFALSHETQLQSALIVNYLNHFNGNCSHVQGLFRHHPQLATDRTPDLIESIGKIMLRLQNRVSHLGDRASHQVSHQGSKASYIGS